MQNSIPLSEKAARMRLARALHKLSQKVIVNKAQTPAYSLHGRYTIIDNNHTILCSGNQLTPWLIQHDILRTWEYVIGEERN